MSMKVVALKIKTPYFEWDVQGLGLERVDE